MTTVLLQFRSPHYACPEVIRVSSTNQKHDCITVVNVFKKNCFYPLIISLCLFYHFGHDRPAVENQNIKCNEPMGYTPISYVIGKRNDGTLRIMMP